MSLARKPIFSLKPFITAVYTANAEGRMIPDRPCHCPSGSVGSNPCRIQIEKWRVRRFGPGFDLAGMWCVSHDHSFTAYPVGWVPYGRKPLVQLDYRGRSICGISGRDFWRGTLFDAVVDAAENRIWPEEINLGPVPVNGEVPGSRRTQRRHIAGAMRLFQLCADCSLRSREQVAAQVGIDLAVLESEAKRIRDGPTILVRGSGGMMVLKTLSATNLVTARLVTLGSCREFWGPIIQC